MNVKSENALYGVEVKLPNKYKIIYNPDEIEIFVSIFEANRTEGKNILVSYFIKNIFGEILYEESDKVFISRVKDFKKIFDISKFKKGNYVISVEVREDGKVSSNSVKFSINEKKIRCEIFYIFRNYTYWCNYCFFYI